MMTSNKMRNVYHYHIIMFSSVLECLGYQENIFWLSSYWRISCEWQNPFELKNINLQVVEAMAWYSAYAHDFWFCNHILFLSFLENQITTDEEAITKGGPLVSGRALYSCKRPFLGASLIYFRMLITASQCLVHRELGNSLTILIAKEISGLSDSEII